MRAPLVVGVLVVAAGIVAGAQRLVPLADGPLFLWAALGVGAGAAALAVRGRARPRGGGRRAHTAAPWVLLALAGALLGTVARAAGDRSCAARLPADLPLTLRGVVTDRAGDRLVITARELLLDGAAVSCVGELPARLDAPGAVVDGVDLGAGIVAVEGRWWRPAGSTGLRHPGLLLVQTVRRVGAEDGGADRDAGAGVGVADRGRAPARGRPGVGRFLTALRASARDRVDGLFGQEAPLAASLLLAQRDGLDRDVRDRFARAGLSHLLAISGLHVALVAGILMLLAGVLRLGKGPGAAAAGFGTLAYVLFLGAPHSAARAALQILLVLGARAAQRPARTEALIATAALVLLAAEPAALFSPGFQLSFAGVAGILALRRPLLRKLRPLTRLEVGGAAVGRWLADGLATSVAATLATAPVVAWHFGRVAPVGIVANLVAIPLLSFTVPALVLALAVGSVWAPAGAYLAGAGSALLRGLDRTAEVAAGAPGAAMIVPGSTAVVLATAVAAGWLVARRLGRVRAGVRWGVRSGVVIAVLLVAPIRPTTDHVEIHVIDVGQGDAIGIRSPAGRWLLVDAGVARERYDAGARLVVPYLARHGVTRLDGLILTHADADHVGGAGAVLSALRPRWVADPGVAAAKGGYLELLREARAAGVPWVAARRGLELELDGVRMEVLHPAGSTPYDDANDGSVVIRVVFGAFEALLTGDAPADVERTLVRRYGRRLESDVLKVGHHGSSTSTTGELLEATGAALALVSAGRGNRYGHPHRVVVDRLETAGLAIARTDRHGSIVVRGGRGGSVTVETERGRVAWH